MTDMANVIYTSDQNKISQFSIFELPLAQLSALALPMVMVVSGMQVGDRQNQFLVNNFSHTQTTIEIRAADALDQQIVNELHRIHSNLMENTVDIDPDCRSVLVENLWDLYG